VLDEIKSLPSNWHGAGTISNSTLQHLAERCPGPYTLTAETGTGRSTLLFSHISRKHLVFAKDDDGDGDSLSRVRLSPLLRPGVVQFVVGPTQITLPQFDLPDELDLALIDGPHGYPFPDLEYYYLYPRIRTGGKLIVDDIQIPSIRSMFRFLKKDAMWDLDSVAGTTAIFTRTDAATFDPLGDGWWRQGYNRQQFIGSRYTDLAKAHAPKSIKKVYRRLRS
jgi:hypothetical protein